MTGDRLVFDLPDMHHWLLFVFWFLWFFLVTLKMSQSLLEDILHKVTLTKSLAMQPKLLAEQDSVSTLKKCFYCSL